jgi:hypothetical protein
MKSIPSDSVEDQSQGQHGNNADNGDNLVVVSRRLATGRAHQNVAVVPAVVVTLEYLGSDRGSWRERTAAVVTLGHVGSIVCAAGSHKRALGTGTTRRSPATYTAAVNQGAATVATIPR